MLKRNRRFLGAEAPRNDRNKGFTMAHLKVRPFKSIHIRVFQQPLKGGLPLCDLPPIRKGCRSVGSGLPAAMHSPLDGGPFPLGTKAGRTHRSAPAPRSASYR